ncbi:serine hydrolase, partial [Arthrospira platensis SPKY1]|nr:serine hydrolase [Arthrospira platensis SPKY1]
MMQEPVHIKELYQPGGRFFEAGMFAQHAVGAYFSYSNSAWGLVASIVEIASGERFDRYTKRVLFDPMGMQASFNAVDIPLTHFGTLYRATDGAWVAQADDVLANPPQERAPATYELGSNGLYYGPQGSLRCSTADLITFLQLFYQNGRVNNQQILQPESLKRMTESRWVYTGANGDTWEGFWMGYGLGLQHIQ